MRAFCVMSENNKQCWSALATGVAVFIAFIHTSYFSDNQMTIHTLFNILKY